MARPIKLRDFIAAVRAADPQIRFLEERGKGSHMMLCKEMPDGGKVSFPIPTASGEVAGPYQRKVIQLYSLPGDVFQKGKKPKKPKKAASETKEGEQLKSKGTAEE